MRLEVWVGARDSRPDTLPNITQHHWDQTAMLQLDILTHFPTTFHWQMVDAVEQLSNVN